MQIEVFSRLQVVFQDPFLKQKSVWKFFKDDQIHCVEPQLQSRKHRRNNTRSSYNVVRNDCALILADEDQDEGHHRFEVVQLHLLFTFVVEGILNIFFFSLKMHKLHPMMIHANYQFIPSRSDL